MSSSKISTSFKDHKPNILCLFFSDFAKYKALSLDLDDSINLSINELLKKVITNPSYRNKIIFDGYPRNIGQAENLELMLNSDNQSINFIFFLKVNREILEKRILGRIICEKCNKTFNEYLNKKEEIEKHDCGTKYLKKRKDDNEEVLVTRYDEYMKKTKPVLDFYSSRSYFHEIDGSSEIQVITNKIEQILTV